MKISLSDQRSAFLAKNRKKNDVNNFYFLLFGEKIFHRNKYFGSGRLIFVTIWLLLVFQPLVERLQKGAYIRVLQKILVKRWIQSKGL